MNQFIEIPSTKRSIAQRTLIHGVGINDAWYKTNLNGVRCPFYRKWVSMITRCYSYKFLNTQSTYKSCSVSEDWFSFSNFKAWMERQYWHDCELDKDILIPGNKIYSPDTCLFIPKSINTLLSDHRSGRGGFPQGVSFNVSRCKYESYCNVNGKRKHLGRYSSSAEASMVYKKFKSDHVRSVAERYIPNETIYNALIRHSNIILNS